MGGVVVLYLPIISARAFWNNKLNASLFHFMFSQSWFLFFQAYRHAGVHFFSPPIFVSSSPLILNTTMCVRFDWHLAIESKMQRCGTAAEPFFSSEKRHPVTGRDIDTVVGAQGRGRNELTVGSVWQLLSVGVLLWRKSSRKLFWQAQRGQKFDAQLCRL